MIKRNNKCSRSFVHSASTQNVLSIAKAFVKEFSMHNAEKKFKNKTLHLLIK